MYKRSLPVEDPPQAKKLRMQDGSVANGASKAGDGLVIDEDLHSRQLAVYGRESMRRMAASSVLIVGALGLGVEIGNSLRPIFTSSGACCNRACCYRSRLQLRITRHK